MLPQQEAGAEAGVVVVATYGDGFGSAFISRGPPSPPALPTRGQSATLVLNGCGINPPTQNFLSKTVASRSFLF